MDRTAGAWRRTTAALVGAVLLLVMGCSDDDDDPSGGDASPAAEESSTTSIASTTTEPACPAVERHAIDGGVAEQEADVDGDGLPDVAQSFPNDGDAQRFTLLVDLAAGGGATLEIEGSADFPVALVGAEELEPGSGRDLLWVRVGAGASTTILGLFHLDGCSLEAATFENGEPVQLPVGGTVGTASGVTCDSGVDAEADLLVQEATNLNEQEYEVVTTEYRWEDGVLVLSPESAPTITQTNDLSAIAGFHCGELSL